MKPTDRVTIREAASHRAVIRMNAQVASKVCSEGRARIRRAKAAWAVES